MDSTRLDRWLWAVRMAKTRTEATTLCRGGHARINGRPAKAAAAVSVGDRIEVRVHGVDRTLVVRRVIEKRVSALVASQCYRDRTPPPPAPAERVAPVARRDPGSGRPTKRDRRQIDHLRGDDR